MGKRIRRALVAAAMTSMWLPLLSDTAPAAEGRDERDTYVNDAGRVEYEVHLPPGYGHGERLPVLVALHGCGMTGFRINSMKDMTRLNEVADARNFIVVYPSQDPLRNLRRCWNGIQPQHQHRGGGEPSLIAGATRAVIERYGADAERVHIAGASSGAGLAVVMAVTYPDVYASAASLAGGEYAFHTVQPDPDAVSPVDTAKLAYAEMGPRARQVPLLIEQGDADTTTPPWMAERLASQWAVLDDLAPDGVLDGDVDDTPDTTQRVDGPGDRPYIRTRYTARDGGPTLIEKYVVEGLGHKWPGGSGPNADPLGPDMSVLLWDFFAKQRLT
ncbi:extracellular catalytic domain type 1 short-chain-length polyhydroxyalkanoate depolymerase [Streptomyces indicus]|uniref:Esterase, PHB depolymerase family n=1 Tax=Streptomyces indicus TaxID=417292 RepID=A0A1G8TVZ1_9ACTN|nr:PHB depolymerase family esterase [Streptomyces indicus]SDJ45662.1 esterase, PHB depolymerase family [Streptomyces indicus]